MGHRKHRHNRHKTKTFLVDKEGPIDTTTSAATTGTKAVKVVSYGGYFCGHKIGEPYPGLFLGSKEQAKDMVKEKQVNILVPLDSLSGSIWDTFRGNIHYIPINDYGVLPRPVAIREAKLIIKWLKMGKKIGMFCIGGHGRTGYFASIVLGLLGIEDPVALVREYCERTIESKQQLDEVADILNKPELKTKYSGAKDYTSHGGAGFRNYYDGYDWYGGGYTTQTAAHATCPVKTSEVTTTSQGGVVRHGAGNLTSLASVNTALAKHNTPWWEYITKKCSDCYEFWDKKGEVYGECLVDGHPASVEDKACKCYVAQVKSKAKVVEAGAE